MARNFRSILRSSLVAILGSIAVFQPLQAQLDTRLQGSKTDFLNLFQQSVNLVMKPEVVTVFDFSGSMAAVMNHPSYVDTGTTSYGALKFSLTSPAAGRYDVTVTLNSGLNLVGGKLVRPDGSLLKYSATAPSGDTDINSNYVPSGLAGETLTPYAADIRNWIRSASHVRFTYGGKTFDLPLCWTILDDPSVQPDVAAGQYRKQYNTYPLKMTIINPGTTSNTEVEMDTSYRVMSQTAGNNWGMFSSTTTTASRMTACTFNIANLTSDNFVGYEGNYIKWIFQGTHSIPQATSAAGKAFLNGIPGRTRTQAVKDAAMRTWVKYYKKVFWAYRFLKYFQPDSTTGQYDSSTLPSNDSRHNTSVNNPLTDPVMGGSQRQWMLLNSTAANPTGSDTALKTLAAMVTGGSTPLSSALLNTYTQLNDPNCIFNDIETGADKPVQCRNTFVILFTDGIPNTDPGTPENINTPYIGGDGLGANYGTAKTGTLFFAPPNAGRINPGNGTAYFNIINLAALAAHGGDTAEGGWASAVYPSATEVYPSPGGSVSIQNWSPFWIQFRGDAAKNEKITFSPRHSITTMTVGVSLYGAITDTSTAATKRRLFLAAAFGEPTRKDWDVSTLTPFALLVPGDPSKGKAATATYFFDATDPEKLTTSLDAAFGELSLQSNINVNANPNLPYIGASFGKQVYFGKFQPPKSGGTIWDGDLLAFSTRESATGIDILNASGNVTTTLDETTAIWSAKAYLKSPPAYPATPVHPHWTLRKVLTRIPWDGNATLTEPGFTRFTDIDTLPAPDNGAYTKIKLATVPSASDADRKKIIQFIMGGNPSGTLVSGRPVDNRSTIMGDIINSSPAAIEYTWSPASAYPSWRSSLPPSISTASGNRFRMIFVGTNQGLLHAFGEVSEVVNNGTTNNQDVVQAHIGELWSFLPTDFLDNLGYVTQTANQHRFLVDGTPTIYHLDIPSSTGAAANGTVDTGEGAMVIIGLRKGGRSYYAIDISTPTAPVLKWSLVPDEAALYGFPSTRIATGGPSPAAVTNIVKSMGFSTATPSIGRMMFDGKMKDVVFFSGGLSLPEIEAKFPDASGNPMKLGRSVLALDVNTGKVLAAVDMTGISATISSIPAGLVPFEFILNSGMAQRAYFLDYGGGLWAWGSRETATTDPYKNFRIDSSDLAYWTTDSGTAGVTRTRINGTGSNAGIRPVAQDGSGTNAKYTTLPAPFRVGAFPGKAVTVSGVTQAPAAAVGVAMVSGDRNNPLDDYTGNLASAPTGHRLTVVFDRQDSKGWLSGNLDVHGIYDTNLKNFTNQNSASAVEIDASNASYYLAPATGNPFFGYYVNFPSATAPFVSKGITEPMVVAGTLFYTYFNPTDADVCTGGNGQSHSMKICDVINPIVTDSRPGLGCTSGEVTYYSGVATAYLAYGTRGVLQAGVTSSGIVTPSGSTTTPRIDRITGRQQERFPKPRVWRTVR